jgi:nicotinamidase/pyrazinamidase
MIERFATKGLPVFATRDWHPANHGSFAEFGGRWPSHCVANTSGAEFSPSLRLPADAIVISKGQSPTEAGYSAFESTDFERHLNERGVRRLFVGGLATDYCVLTTVRDALARGFAVVLLVDAVRAIGDGQQAIDEMVALGAAAVHDEDAA